MTWVVSEVWQSHWKDNLDLIWIETGLKPGILVMLLRRGLDWFMIYVHHSCIMTFVDGEKWGACGMKTRQTPLTPILAVLSRPHEMLDLSLSTP